MFNLSLFCYDLYMSYDAVIENTFHRIFWKNCHVMCIKQCLLQIALYLKYVTCMNFPLNCIDNEVTISSKCSTLVDSFFLNIVINYFWFRLLRKLSMMMDAHWWYTNNIIRKSVRFATYWRHQIAKWSHGDAVKFRIFFLPLRSICFE